LKSDKQNRMKRITRALAIIFCLAMIKVSGAATLVGRGGNCLDDAAGGKANGNNIQMWQCQSGNVNQQWAFDNGNVVLAGTKKCLDVAGGGTANGTRVQLWDCQVNNTNQKWSLNPAFPGNFVWIGGKCLDVNGGGTASGTKVQVWDCMAGNDN
jgi:hypothetical protein